ncbi:hypothetical protein D9M70_346260 [compost metagenome]
MQALHDHDDRRVVRVVLARFQGVLEPVEHAFPDCVAVRFVGLVRVVDDDRTAEARAMLAGAVAGDGAARAGGVHDAALGGAPFVLCRAVRAQLRLRENLAIGLVSHQLTRLPSVVRSQLCRVASVDELGVRHLAQAPCHPVDHRQLGLRVARRDVDHQALALTAVHPHQRITDHLVVRRAHPLEALALQEHPAGEEVEVSTGQLDRRVALFCCGGHRYTSSLIFLASVSS